MIWGIFWIFWIALYGSYLVSEAVEGGTWPFILVWVVAFAAAVFVPVLLHCRP